jgi:DNA-binding MarR family transcriptional regulator
VSQKIEAFLGVARSVRRLFHQLRAAAEAAYDYEPGFTAAHRAVLESLATHGAETVPALARARLVARQHIQVLVNELEGFGFVVPTPNPAHKRSPLIALTPAGKKRFDAMRRAEHAYIARIELGLSERELARAGSDLERLSAALGRALER